MDRAVALPATALDRPYCSIRHAAKVAELPESALRNWLAAPLRLTIRDREGKPRLSALGVVGARIAGDLAYRGPLMPADASAIALAALDHLRALANRAGIVTLAALHPSDEDRPRWGLNAVFRDDRAVVFPANDPPASEVGRSADPARVVVLLDLAQIVREVVAADLALSLDEAGFEPGDDAA